MQFKQLDLPNMKQKHQPIGHNFSHARSVCYINHSHYSRDYDTQESVGTPEKIVGFWNVSL
jgi:hypothetical protein